MAKRYHRHVYLPLEKKKNKRECKKESDIEKDIGVRMNRASSQMYALFYTMLLKTRQFRLQVAF